MEDACDRFARNTIPDCTRRVGSFSLCGTGSGRFKCRGLGQVTAMSLDSPKQLVDEIRRTKELTDKPFGVNFAIGQHGRPYEHMLEAAMEQGIAAVSVTGGNPGPFLDCVKDTSVKKLVLVAATRQAVKAEQLGADAVMVVGQEGADI